MRTWQPLDLHGFRAVLLAAAASWMVACGGDGASGASTPEPSGGTGGTDGSGGASGGMGGNPMGGMTSIALEAEDDEAVTAQGVAVIIDVLANDETPEDAILVAFENGAKGSVTLRADGRLAYLPLPGEDGEDEFSYRVRAGSLEVSARVGVRILPTAGTVAGGKLYQAIKSAHRADATELQIEKGFFWTDINRNGDALGQYRAQAGHQIFIRTAEGNFIDIDLPDELPTEVQTVEFGDFGAHGLNDHRQVAGWWADPDWIMTGWVYDPDDGVSVWNEAELEFLTPMGIDNSGTVVGFLEYYEWPPENWHSFARPAGQAAEEVALFGAPDLDNTMAFSINEHGVIAGTVNDGDEGHELPQRCFTRDLSTSTYDVRDNPEGIYSVSCRNINDTGVLVGRHFRAESSVSPQFAHRGFIWSDDGFFEVHLPFPSPPGKTRRGEEVVAIGADGTLLANINHLDGTIEAVELIPVEAAPHTYFEDTHYDLVGLYDH